MIYTKSRTARSFPTANRNASQSFINSKKKLTTIPSLWEQKDLDLALYIKYNRYYDSNNS